MIQKKRILILLLILISLFAISKFTPFKDYLNLEHIRDIKPMVEQYPVKGSILFFVGSSALIITGLPKSIICMAAGIIFGFWKGLILASISIVCGSLVIFILARYLGAESVYKRFKNHLNIIKEYKGNQFVMVLLIKQIPMPCLINNALLGLTSISTDIFIIGSLIGQLPTNVIFTLYGSSIHGNIILKVSIASLLAVLLFAFLKLLLPKSGLVKNLSVLFHKTL